MAIEKIFYSSILYSFSDDQVTLKIVTDLTSLPPVLWLNQPEPEPERFFDCKDKFTINDFLEAPCQLIWPNNSGRNAKKKKNINSRAEPEQSRARA